MPGGVNLRPEESDDSWLALARERFLTAEPIEPGRPAPAHRDNPSG